MSSGLIVICGATATGKSGFAQYLAEKFSLPILNADSRQIYKDFSIGTAKPSERDRRRAHHTLVDEIDPRITFTVANYQARAQTLIAAFHDQGITPILAGGTGLYIKSVTRGLKIPQVAPQTELRSQLNTWPQSIRYQWLQQVDAPSSKKIHAHDQVRTLRALEVFYVTGQPLSRLQGESPPAYPILSIGLEILDETQKNQRIRDRITKMLHWGWLNEIAAIQTQYGTDLPLLNTLGYAEMQAYLSGESSLEAAQELTAIHTRQFAKRQSTWFHAQPDIQWLDPTAPGTHTQFQNLTDQFLLSTKA
jgi:tRNA dimethylallyltransferase